MLSPAVLEYRERIFKKTMMGLSGSFRVLNLGCAQGHDNKDFAENSVHVVGMDILPFEQWRELTSPKSSFIVGSGCLLPFKDGTFDIIFTKDVLHHIGEHEVALGEILRVLKTNRTAYVLESNRYNPISYFHMTLMKDHQHFTQSYFRKLILASLRGCSVTFNSFEAHVIPLRHRLLRALFYLAEDLMEKTPFVNKLLSYNLATIRKNPETSSNQKL